MRATYSAQLILLELIIILTSGEECKQYGTQTTDHFRAVRNIRGTNADIRDTVPSSRYLCIPSTLPAHIVCAMVFLSGSVTNDLGTVLLSSCGIGLSSF
jgi:hypothetical protein